MHVGSFYTVYEYLHPSPSTPDCSPFCLPACPPSTTCDSLLGDGTNAVLQGLLRGAGRQETGALTNLLTYWCCGIPLAAFLAFKRGMGLEGLWWGLVVINTLQGGIMLTITALFDFEGQADKTADMLAMSSAAAHENHQHHQHQHQRQASAAEEQQQAAGEVGNPLLAPLLQAGGSSGGGGGGSVEAAVGLQGRAARGRSGDATGLQERLQQSLVMLLTEGVPHSQPQHLHSRSLPVGAGSRAQGRRSKPRR